MFDLSLDAAAKTFPRKIALRFAGTTYSYSDLDALSQRLSAALSRLGIQGGDRVAFLLPNGLEIVLCYYACFKIGAVAVPLNIRFGPELLRHVIEHSEARMLVSDPELFLRIEKIRSALPRVEHYYLTAGHSEFAGVAGFPELLTETPTTRELPVRDENNPAAIYYTSGTTGLPKAVVHTHGSLRQAIKSQTQEIGISSDDITVIMFPVCYLIGFGSQILPFHNCGATCVLLPRFEPQVALEAIQTYQATKIYGFPQLYNDLVTCPEAGQYNLRSLNFCFSAGEAIPVAIQERFRQIFGLEITEGCGMTELQIYSMNPPYGRKRIGSIGRPIADMEMSLIDDRGSPITTAGKIGEMIVRGGSMTAGYWRNPELTAQNIRKGWFHTGDLASKDEDDFYWFVSRKSEIIRHQAGLVSPVEVEGALYRHSRVREAGVVGVPDRSGYQQVWAFVVLRMDQAPVSEQELMDFTQTHLKEHKVPSKIIFREELPHGPTGKIDRKTLREHAIGYQI